MTVQYQSNSSGQIPRCNFSIRMDWEAEKMEERLKMLQRIDLIEARLANKPRLLEMYKKVIQDEGFLK